VGSNGATAPYLKKMETRLKAAQLTIRSPLFSEVALRVTMYRFELLLARLQTMFSNLRKLRRLSRVKIIGVFAHRLYRQELRLLYRNMARAERLIAKQADHYRTM